MSGSRPRRGSKKGGEGTDSIVDNKGQREIKATSQISVLDESLDFMFETGKASCVLCPVGYRCAKEWLVCILT